MSAFEFEGLSEDLIQSIMESLDQLPYLRLEDIPGIDLYMDQVTTFMDDRLATSKRLKDDKILTKTMINNYAKNKLLPPPVKKKYSRDHLLVLLFIYYFKGILPLQDIQSLLGPLTEQYFKAQDGPDLGDVYQEIVRCGIAQTPRLREELSAMFESARESFPDADDKDGPFLRYFTLICLLSIDVYMKKRVIEQLIDGARAKKPEK